MPLHAHKARAASGSGLGAVRWIPDPRRLGGAVRDQRMRLGTAATKNSPLPNAVLDQADFKFQVPLRLVGARMGLLCSYPLCALYV